MKVNSKISETNQNLLNLFEIFSREYLEYINRYRSTTNKQKQMYFRLQLSLLFLFQNCSLDRSFLSKEILLNLSQGILNKDVLIIEDLRNINQLIAQYQAREDFINLSNDIYSAQYTEIINLIDLDHLLISFRSIYSHEKSENPLILEKRIKVNFISIHFCLQNIEKLQKVEI